MRLLIIECGESKLSSEITAVAGELKPKPIMISTMNVSLDRLKLAEFKRMLYHSAPDTIVVNPPDVEPEPNQNNWTALLNETLRYIGVTSGRLLFISSVEVLGDAYQRTEDAVAMPASDYGIFLHTSEMLVEESTPCHYILRLPYTAENKEVLAWIAEPGNAAEVFGDQWFTLITLKDIAKVIVERIQTGLYGKYHASPNDRLALSDLVATQIPQIRILDRSLSSKYTWPIQSSAQTWAGLDKRTSK